MKSTDMKSMDRQLISAYQQARYLVRLDAQLHLFRIGLKYPLLDQLLTQNDCHCAVFITAFNPASELYPLDINLSNNRRLQWELKNKGFNYLAGFGGDDKGEWPKEESMLVFGAAIAEADRWAIDYRQNAYLVIEVGAPVSLRCISKGEGLD